MSFGKKAPLSMRAKYRRMLFTWTVLLGLSLFSLVYNSFTYHPHGSTALFIWLISCFVRVVVAGYSLFQLRDAIYLRTVRLFHRIVLQRRADRLIARNPFDPKGYAERGVALLRQSGCRLAEAMNMLPWRGSGHDDEDFQALIIGELGVLAEALSAFESALRLEEGTVFTTGRTVFPGSFPIPWNPILVAESLQILNELLAQPIEKLPPDGRGLNLLRALWRVVLVLSLAPLSIEAYEHGSVLMSYLHQEDLVQKFDSIRTRLVNRADAIAARSRSHAVPSGL